MAGLFDPKWVIIRLTLRRVYVCAFWRNNFDHFKSLFQYFLFCSLDFLPFVVFSLLMVKVDLLRTFSHLFCFTLWSPPFLVVSLGLFLCPTIKFPSWYSLMYQRLPFFHSTLSSACSLQFYGYIVCCFLPIETSQAIENFKPM